MGLGLKPERVEKTPVRRFPPSLGGRTVAFQVSRHAGMKDKDDPDMGKILEPFKCFHLIERRKHFQYGAGFRCQAGLAGNAEFFLETGVDDADRFKREFHGESL